MSIWSQRRYRLAVWFLFAYAALCAVAGVLVADGTLHPQRRKLDTESVSQAEQVAQSAGSNLEDVSISSQDRLLLKAWLIRPASNNGNAVLLLHGLSDNRSGMIGYAELFLGRGYTVLMPDARANGESQGMIATYGLLERQDIRDWAQFIKEKVHPPCVYALGESMGAAQLLQSISADSPFCAVAAESSFSNLQEIGYDRIGQFFGTGPWLGRTLLRPVIEVVFAYSRWRYGFDLRRVSPEAAVAKANVPVLLIHGQVDSNIRVRHSRRIKAIAPGVTLWEVPGADHCGAISTAPSEFAARVLALFQPR